MYWNPSEREDILKNSFPCSGWEGAVTEALHLISVIHYNTIMAYIKIEAEVVGQVVIGGTQIVANHLDSLGYIPGSMLRGALVALWNTSDTESERFLDLFCRGAICFRGLFPIPSGSEGTDFLNKSYFPFRMPFSVFTCKYYPGMGRGDHGYVDKAKQLTVSEKDNCFINNCDAPLKQCKNVSFYYKKEGGDKPEAINIKREIYIYHGTERFTRTAKESALYSYSSVNEGERFLGWLTGKRDDLKEFWEKLNISQIYKSTDSSLACKLRIGRAKKRRGYLCCTLKFVDPKGEINTHNGETGHPLLNPGPAPQLDDDNMIIVFQTPAILYDSLFRPGGSLDIQDIFDDEYFRGKVTKVKEFSNLIQIDGWSNIHKLPRRPDTAIAAGSTFVFKLNQSLIENEENRKKTLDLFETIQKKGIGERKNEGFGQLLINPYFNRKSQGGVWWP